MGFEPSKPRGFVFRALVCIKHLFCYYTLHKGSGKL